MLILFLVYHGFSEHSGMTKKIHYQVIGLRENGHDVRLCYYGFAGNGHRCRYIDGTILKDYDTGRLADLRQRISYESIYNYFIREKIEFIYALSFMNATPWLICFFRKLRKIGIKADTEIPTYPYDQELSTFSKKERFVLKVDKLFRNWLAKEMSAIVTFSDEERIFGQRTIRISNGVDFDSIPLHQYQTSPDGSVLLIGVAEVHLWHGFDRVMTGLGEYYAGSKGEKCELREVRFHVVGGVHPSQMSHCFMPIIEKYQLHDKVILHGQLFDKALDEVFDQCQFAIGSLGRHRTGITVIKTLKNRECATRGIPFIYSKKDSDFDNQSYVLRAPADESLINIQRIIDFVDNFSMKPKIIRKSVEHLNWKQQMKEVVDAIHESYLCA